MSDEDWSALPPDPAGEAKEKASLEQIAATLAMVRKVGRLKKYNKILFFEPYPKQRDFFEMGRTLEERLLMAGNQLGKTEAGAAEITYHLTGEYPDWWKGRRWDRPTKGWIAGETSLAVRDTQQKKLCGEPGVADAFGTGYIPLHAFADKPTLARGVSDAFDTIQVKHKSGGISIAKFKSYEQGREKFQADTLDWVWCDEEPPMDVYSECLARFTATKGMIFLTFTPLKGRSAVVNRFLDEPSPARSSVIMTIEDALHIAPEERAAIIAKYLPHEREARTRGLPLMGSGLVFPYSDDSIGEEAIPMADVPPQWAKIWGIDFGIEHPFAAALLLWDKDNDIIHVHFTHRITDQSPLQHAVVLKHVAGLVPVAWPHDGGNREKGSLESLASLYSKQGLKMLPEKATWPDGSNSVETGIIEMQMRMADGRLKVARHLADFFQEKSLYHRKDGLLVKQKDDLLSAVRYGIMMRRFARPVPLGSSIGVKKRQPDLATGIDFELFA